MEEQGCLDNCKKFISALVDDFALQAAATIVAAVPRVNGDKVEFDVAAEAIEDARPAELNEAFPVSGGKLSYLLTVNKATGDIVLDNKKGQTYTLKAYDEASYYQEIDYGKTDLADVNKSHYAYVSFDPKVKANVIEKQASLRRQWKLTDGSAQPSPGVSIMVSTHWQDCPGGQSTCDIIMLTTNPKEDESGGGGGDPADLGGEKGVTGHVNGVQQKVTGQMAFANNGPGGVIVIKGMAAALGGANWDLVIQPEEGEQVCNTTAGVYIQYSTLGSVEAWTTANKNGTCVINVGKVTATEVSGTFTADLGPGDSNTDKGRRSVTQGAFHLNR